MIRAEYAGPAALAKDPTYPTLPEREKTKKFAGPKTTTAAELRATAIRTSVEAATTEVKPWKMKKFEGVKSKLVMPGP